MISCGLCRRGLCPTSSHRHFRHPAPNPTRAGQMHKHEFMEVLRREFKLYQLFDLVDVNNDGVLATREIARFVDRNPSFRFILRMQIGPHVEPFLQVRAGAPAGAPAAHPRAGALATGVSLLTASTLALQRDGRRVARSPTRRSPSHPLPSALPADQLNKEPVGGGVPAGPERRHKKGRRRLPRAAL